jgi:hypothetical protein
MVAVSVVVTSGVAHRQTLRRYGGGSLERRCPWPALACGRR